jgi:hypothetical protein
MLRRLVMVLAGVLLLAGCQDDPEPIVADPTPSPTVVSSSPAESAEPETAEAFIRRWSEASIAMQNTGDSSVYRSLTAGCSTCAKFADLVDTYYKAGGYISIGGQRIKSISPIPADAPNLVYDVSVDPKPTRYAEEAGGPAQTLRGDPAVLRVTLKQEDSSWKLVDYTQLTQ